MRIRRLRELSAEQTNRILYRAAQTREEVYSRAREIMGDVRTNGDEALRKLTRQLDRATLTDLAASDAEFEAAYRDIDAAVVRAIRRAMENLERFHRAQRRADAMITVGEGIRVGRVSRPIESVGIYVPGGKYPYPSSVLMNGVPAGLAGCPQRIICTPPSPQGTVAAPILVAADLVGIRRVYKIGGAQAVAAMAYGMEGLEPVHMIVGAGNVYVAEAKRQLFGKVGIDLLAGPTEILVLVDETADPYIVAADILGQAEHDPNSRQALVSLSKEVAEKTVAEIEKQLKTLPTREVAEVSWKNNGEVILVDSPEEALEVCDKWAPEHLEVQTKDWRFYLDNLRNYGSLFLGEETTVAYGDKSIGTNHVLPTMEAATYTGGLYVGKFLKVVTYQYATKNASAELAAVCERACNYENMLAHGISCKVRVEKYGK